MTLTNKIFSFLFGIMVGKDELGNCFYESKKLSRHFNRRMRWVVYNGIPEPTKIQVNWYCWLSYQSNQLPTSNRPKSYIWIQCREINLTGLNKKRSLINLSISRFQDTYIAWKPKQ